VLPMHSSRRRVQGCQDEYGSRQEQRGELGGEIEEKRGMRSETPLRSYNTSIDVDRYVGGGAARL